MARALSVVLACAAVVLCEPPPPHPYSYPTPSYGPPPAYGPQPSYKPAYCDPTKPPSCAAGSHLPYCLDDPEYPEYDIKNAITADHLFAKKYADVADQSADDLVEYVTKK
ncbi:hypothetical protein OTU49_000803, partial [Cherax quadricarinatus]